MIKNLGFLLKSNQNQAGWHVTPAEVFTLAKAGLIFMWTGRIAKLYKCEFKTNLSGDKNAQKFRFCLPFEYLSNRCEVTSIHNWIHIKFTLVWTKWICQTNLLTWTIYTMCFEWGWNNWNGLMDATNSQCKNKQRNTVPGITKGDITR